MNFDEIKKYFTREKIQRDSLVTAIFFFAGLVLFTLMFIMASLFQRGGSIYHLLQNLGIFFVFAGMALAFAAIHRGNVSPGEQTVRSLAVATAKQAPVVTGILFCSVIAIFIVALAELVLSLIGYIPYAGPVMVALLSLPLFAVNFAVIAAVVMVWMVLPPMAGEGTDLRKMPMDFYTLMKKRGLIIFGYTMITIVIFVVIFGGVLIVIRYATGITRSVQWNIAPAYPPVFKAIISSSYITDVISKIAPRTDPIAALREYGSGIFNYIDMLGTLLKVIYGVTLAVIASFVLGVFFNVLSHLYVRAKKDVI
ncbi:MAG TPA: hypothetical protein PL180_12845 [Spirochaetota bacterium]|nr:hypothetical protein [Spirochaetota bacterium]HQJ69632.1 hypothetical protein [Spirochaetota bacterium]HRS76580.1 hypothetical protein [Spirochaetota bacterium]HRT75009.1 hypothetical protein [Spirochaetota bacterium]